MRSSSSLVLVVVQKFFSSNQSFAGNNKNEPQQQLFSADDDDDFEKTKFLLQLPWSSSSSSPSSSSVTIVSEENVLPYERPALSKAFLNEQSPARLPGFHTCVGGGGERQTEEWYKEKEVETKLGTKITKCDYEKKRVETASGEIIEYDALVIATGV